MAWTIILLISVAIILLIMSYVLSKQTFLKEQQESKALYAALMKELQQIKLQNRKIELDIEILAQEDAIKSTTEQRLLMREVLDLHRRQYSIETIAAKTGLNEKAIESMIAPYVRPQIVRGMAANDS